jgi:hypothetical protein
MMLIREWTPGAALVGIAMVLALLMVLVVADPASAAVSNVGKNLGDEASSWAKALVFPFAALGGLGAYFKRDIGMAFSLFIITMIVGAFAYNPGNALVKLIGSLVSALAG